MQKKFPISCKKLQKVIWFFNISVYTNDDNIIFYSLPEQHSQPDVEVIFRKNGRCEKFTRNKKKITKSGKNKIKIMQRLRVEIFKKNGDYLYLREEGGFWYAEK